MLFDGDIMPDSMPSVAVIGGGLAGCETAFALAQRGVAVTLFEMKPEGFSPAHSSPDLAELVCSNSMRSDDPGSAVGLLKQEMRELGSLTMDVAESTKVPAGKALAVDRELFSSAVTERIAQHPAITLVRREVTDLGSPLPECPQARAVVVAAGPLASPALSESLSTLLGAESLYFYDAIAPIVTAESVDMTKAFWGARYKPEETDYLNCPMNKEEYFAFYEALLAAEKTKAKDFEKELHFEGCMPIEALAERGAKTLVFGSLKPVGFTDPRTDMRPYALLQLRAENRNKSTLNLVGCQTKLTYAAQAAVFRMIPGLEQAEFVRFGSMHRNTFVNAPKVLAEDLSLRAAPHIFLAGQITGVEGYVESAACGLWLGHALAAKLAGRNLPVPPPVTALGALLGHLQSPAKRFQPSNVQFGLMPELGERAKKLDRKALYAQRGRDAFREWLESAPILNPS